MKNQPPVDFSSDEASADEILDAIKAFYGLRFDNQLSEKLSITSANLSAWRKRGFLREEVIRSRCPELNFDILFREGRAVQRVDTSPIGSYEGELAVADPAAIIDIMKKLKESQRLLQEGVEDLALILGATPQQIEEMMEGGNG